MSGDDEIAPLWVVVIYGDMDAISLGQARRIWTIYCMFMTCEVRLPCMSG